jgi:hypothetical protein
LGLKNLFSRNRDTEHEAAAPSAEWSRKHASPTLERPFQLQQRYSSRIAGESNYQEAIAGTARLAQPEPDEDGNEELRFEAILVREPSNPYDARAVAVYSPAGLVGYAPRGSEWCDLLDLLAERGHDGVTCRAKLTGGEQGKSWGIVLYAYPKAELERLSS